jgi:tetratricopeptide (TPR) repeat protein
MPAFALSASEQKSVNSHIIQGMAAMRSGDFEAALAQFQEASRLDPHSSQPFVWIGITDNQLARFKDAASAFHSALHIDPASKTAHYNLALTFIRLDDKAAAVREFEEAVKIDPALADAQYNLAVLLAGEEHYRPAIAHLEAARKLRPNDLGIETLLARCYLETGNPAAAIDMLLPLKDSDPSGHATYTLGLAYRAAGKHEEAEQAFRSSAAKNPDDAASHFQLGLSLMSGPPNANNSAGAEELAKAIQLAPQEERYYIPLASWLLEVDRAEPALTLLQHAMENVTPDADLYVLLGLAQASVNGTRTAQPSIEKAIALDPHIALAHNVLGYCYFTAGDSERALQSYKTAATLSPSTPRFTYDAGLLLEKMQRTTDALPYAQKAVQLQPGNGDYHYLLGKIDSELNRDQDTISELEAAVQIDPQMEAAHYLLGRTYRRMGYLEKAQAEFAKVQQLKQASNRQMPAADTSPGAASENVPDLSPALLLATPQIREKPTPPR